MRFFPIVPRNDPADDLEQYLEPFDRERAALVSVLDGSAKGKLHAEWDINPPPPVMRAGWGPSGHRVSQYALGRLSAVGDIMGLDPTRTVAANGDQVVSALWLQRALNAARYPVDVDGIAGPQTLTVATHAWDVLTGSHGTAPAVTNRGTSMSSPGRVMISGFFATLLASYRQVDDPPRTPASSPAQPPPPAGDMYVTQPSYASGGGLLLLAAAAAAAWYTFK